jgi:branched-subunit amino acid aminotransferase/4-amino-4-deoxychorismate lyase
VLDGVLRTYPQSNVILPGITRAVLMEIIHAEGLRCEERPVPLAELHRAEEVFVCGTTTDVQAIVTLDGQPVGTGTVGPITAKLRDLLARRLYGR